MQKLLGVSGSGGTDLEALQGWLLKFGWHRKILHTSVETFADWISNKKPPWDAYPAFIFGRLILLDRQPGVHPVSVEKRERCLFSEILIKVAGPEATSSCQDDELCTKLNVGIDGAVHRVQAMWDSASTM